MGAAEQWEPDDTRVSRPVLRERGGAIPPRHSPDALPRTAQNFPVQANAAEIMRYAAIAATESGLAICCSIHDAFLVEASIVNIRDVEAALCRIMVTLQRRC